MVKIVFNSKIVVDIPITTINLAKNDSSLFPLYFWELLHTPIQDVK